MTDSVNVSEIYVLGCSNRVGQGLGYYEIQVTWDMTRLVFDANFKKFDIFKPNVSSETLKSTYVRSCVVYSMGLVNGSDRLGLSVASEFAVCMCLCVCASVRAL